MKRLVPFVVCALALASHSASAQSLSASATADPRGRWITSSGNLEVEVATCGEALCGTVVKVLANRSMSRDGGEMKAVDTRDPMGMKLLIDFAPTQFRDGVATKWEGQIYNRENGKTYRCIMTLGPAGELALRGYVGLPLFGRTSAWQRAGVAIGGAN